MIEPKRVKKTASYPFPSSSNSWPGSVDRAVSSSGAPKNIEGIKSIKVWVIDIETIKITRIKGEIKGNVRSQADRESKIAATRLICIPGERPVNVPASIPTTIAISIPKSSSII
jgi:hypothetical protein